MAKEESRPDGWEKLRPEGSPDGLPEVGHDKRRHQNYHVRPKAGEPGEWEIVYHGVPEVYTFRDGVLVPKEPEAGEPPQTLVSPGDAPPVKEGVTRG